MSNEIEIELSEDLEVQEPKKYNVFLLNDDYSTMEFVIDVLVKIFRKTVSEAEAIMLNVHNNGKGLCGVYSFEIATTKVAQVKTMAREKGFPLKATMEEE
ncbi:ATP-dependent Clp protease adaptor ClpS [Aliarcobacter cibarius]|uniref:ATP-dependent Clp protease adapter protein ClpS n=1 Tax=Aliarcobacter cibarius TaxID=255507 RepID=A0A5J6RIN4_9BACT|nr:ATP-dependent Clp protease adaptor ClpS [Aliarcobacter cibarius]QEZ88578.1 ClpAP chaperone-protease complex specificity factor [Aliarcobacter cibarius]QKJ26618.1 ClpAP chaperone-protease complex specificity factor [Aliarcobacter cibarius]TLS95857.1 ATP-dependent Clp protease adaptor ClpS [Aliarcobacter cibarius]TLS96334.1 ATP-dependent Clp protease adaptor ClpS [Aliarcobacter cibarius]TLT02432.1 ATP-dependent Clp protease adaptor ClpS [Aliarcobacter cibarius]